VPYFKCVPCRTRVPATGGDTPDRSCPSCGMALVPVADLTEVMGFQSRDLIEPSVPAGGAEVEIDRWLDEGGNDEPERLARAVALERPL